MWPWQRHATEHRLVNRKDWQCMLKESVWDYPRPPRCESSSRLITVEGPDSRVIAQTRTAWRVLETSHPPTWYVPPGDVTIGVLSRSGSRQTLCEWKGLASYWNVHLSDGTVLADAAWSYETPTPGFTAITSYLAFSPSQLVCSVDAEQARPQEGGFYGGWITDDLIGPFKGAPGTLGW